MLKYVKNITYDKFINLYCWYVHSHQIFKWWCKAYVMWV